MAKLATGFDALAIRLEQWVSYYTPKGWVEPIRAAMHYPYFLKEDAQLLFEANACDVLQDGIDGSYRLTPRTQ